MKKIIPALLACFITAFTIAQDVRLNDSVIFINNKPVALYAKEINSSVQRYNMEVYSFDDYVLIKAEVIKFAAPVVELESFYYYEITFPPTADTFAIYIEDEAFPLVLAKMIRDYDLINKNELNKKNLSRFITNYPGGHAFTAKIKSFETYLNETRHFSEQVKRDRTKPVTIIGDKIIMQDGVKIGFFSYSESSRATNRPTSVIRDKSSYGLPITVVEQNEIIYSRKNQVFLANGTEVYIGQEYYDYWNSGKSKKQVPTGLFEISKTKDLKNAQESLLRDACFLIENYAL